MLVASVELYLEDPNRLSAVIDEIYKPAAKRCRCTSDNVERNIRTIIQQAWRKDLPSSGKWQAIRSLPTQGL